MWSGCDVSAIAQAKNAKQNKTKKDTVCFIKTDTLYTGGNLYKVYPF